MASKPLQDLDSAALYKRRSQLKGILIAFAIIWGLLLAVSIYLVLVKRAGFAYIALSAPMTYPWVPIFYSLSKINAEIKLRNANI